MAESPQLEEKIPSPLEARIIDRSGGGRKVVSGLATSLSGKALRLSVPVSFALLAPVTVECGNALFMGDVIACEPASYGFDVEIEASLALEDVAGIESMASHFSRGKIAAASGRQETGEFIA